MASNATVKCPPTMKPTSNGVFQGDNPLDFALPLVIVQMCLVLLLTRTLAYLLKPLRQPRVIAEIIGGILLGPSALGRNTDYLHKIFPARSLPVLDTLANLGLLFFLFLVGLELDPKSLRRTGKKALGISAAGITLPFALGTGVSFVLRKTISQDVSEGPFLVFMGVALSITAFPVLARILAELKLLTTEVGRTAMSAAAVNDVVAWILLALAIALSGAGRSPLVSLWVFLSGAGFVAVCVVICPPVFRWMARRCPEGEPVQEIYVCCTLGAVLVAGFATDAIGIHALFGAFVIGVLVPKEGALATALVENVEDLVSGLFLPLFFVSSGLKTNVATIRGAQSWGLLVLVICAACFGKIAGTVVASLCSKIPVRDALTLGFLMNTKGLVELIVLNIGKDRGVLNDQAFAILVLMALFTTFITTPIVVAIYKPTKTDRSELKYNHNRTIQRKGGASGQLRLLTCFHNSRNIPSLINLIEASRGTGKKGEVEGEGLGVYAMHLMEFSERSSAILTVHKARRDGLSFWNNNVEVQNVDRNQIEAAFEAFRHLSRVSVKPTTTISRLVDIHEDICNSAEDKCVSMIIVPFHKHHRLDGNLETTKSEFRNVNRRILQHAPCSVGILVDRGLGGAACASNSIHEYTITALFFGGHDDREALSYGAVMAEHPGIHLIAVRFTLDPAAVIAGETVSIDIPPDVGDDESYPEETASESKDDDDEEFLSDFKTQIEMRSTATSIKFEEKMVQSCEETVEVIQSYNRCNLFVVGRMPEGQVAAASLGKHQTSECPELGPLGDLLTSSGFTTTASVLIVQQYRPELPSDSLQSPIDEPAFATSD